MKFYNKEKELAQLKLMRERPVLSALMTVVVGRRRIRKTSLLKKSIENQRSVFLFIAKKNEALLCREVVEIIKISLDVNLFGKITQFKNLFSWLMELSEKRTFTLIIDEFQEFININGAVF